MSWWTSHLSASISPIEILPYQLTTGEPWCRINPMCHIVSAYDRYMPHCISLWQIYATLYQPMTDVCHIVSAYDRCMPHCISLWQIYATSYQPMTDICHHIRLKQIYASYGSVVHSCHTIYFTVYIYGIQNPIWTNSCSVHIPNTCTCTCTLYVHGRLLGCI